MIVVANQSLLFIIIIPTWRRSIHNRAQRRPPQHLIVQFGCCTGIESVLAYLSLHFIVFTGVPRADTAVHIAARAVWTADSEQPGQVSLHL